MLRGYGSSKKQRHLAQYGDLKKATGRDMPQLTWKDEQ